MISALEDFNKLTPEEQRAWLGFFAGGKSYVTHYETQPLHVHFGKYECEKVPFPFFWMQKLVKLGWVTVEKMREGTARGMHFKPRYIEYRIWPTDKGDEVYNAYWDQFKKHGAQR